MDKIVLLSSEEDIANRLAVNISSSRVRMAMQLIEGIRNACKLLF